MSKSILVIDTPNCCIGCPCHFAGISGQVWCGKEKKEILTDDIETFKPDWCPLKDVPEKKEQKTVITYFDGWNSGYNTCIDEILKGANGNE